MTKVGVLAVALILILGMREIDADNCINDLAASINTYGATCDAVKILVKCLLRSGGLTNQTTATDDKLDTIKEEINPGLAEIGLYCDLDYRALVNELQEEDNPGQTTTGYQGPSTGNSAGYNNATSRNACYQTFLSHQSLTCGEVNLYVKCIIKFPDSAEFVKHIQSNFYEMLESTFNVQPQNYTLCNESVQSLYEKMSREQNKGGDDSGSSFYPFHVLTLIAFSALLVTTLR